MRNGGSHHHNETMAILNRLRLRPDGAPWLVSHSQVSPLSSFLCHFGVKEFSDLVGEFGVEVILCRKLQ